MVTSDEESSDKFSDVESEGELYYFLQTLILDIVTQFRSCSVSNLSCFLSQLFISPYTIQANYLCSLSFLFLSNINFFYSLPSLLITNSFTMFFYNRFIRGILQQPLLVYVYCCLEDFSENQLSKYFCCIKNKQTHCLHVLVQQTNKLRLRESL